MGFMAMGYHLQAKQKARADTPAVCGLCGSGSRAQAQIDIQKFFLLAVAAVGIAFDLAVRAEAKEFHLLAVRAQHVSVLH